ncbi:MAG: glycosyltransferase [Bacteroidota bacterium]
MEKSGKYSHGIVIPCYNESSRLDLSTYIDFARRNKGTVLCLVNDGSADDTRATLAEIKNLAHDNVLICHVPKNAGKANAVRTGSLMLHKETDVDTIGFLDADLSTSFMEYHELLETYHSHSDKLIVFGSRNLKESGGNIERNPIRKLLSEFIRMLIFFIIRVKIADTQCGAKVFARQLIPDIYEQSFHSRWLFDIEIILRLRLKLGTAGFLHIFQEKALNEWIHVDGSKLGIKDAIMIPLNLIQIWKTYNFRAGIEKLKQSAMNTARSSYKRLILQIKSA